MSAASTVIAPFRHRCGSAGGARAVTLTRVVKPDREASLVLRVRWERLDLKGV
jgi:hypothetical protein